MLSRTARRTAAALAVAAAVPAAASAQALSRFDARDADETPIYDSPKDSIAAFKTAEKAAKARDYRVVISLAKRQLWVVQASDTIMSAPVGIGSASRRTGAATAATT